MAPPTFTFPSDTLAFLTELRANNDKTWFDANRDRYQASYVEPAKAFVETVAPALRKIAPEIEAEPRVLGSIFRINRDTRFSTDKRPYKDHLDLWFWHGDRKTAVSGLFLRIAPDEIIVGAGAHGFDRERLAHYRDAVAHDEHGASLARLVARIEKAGYGIGGETYARTPRTHAVDAGRERFLRHSALYGERTEPATLAVDRALVPALLRHWAALAPLHAWLVATDRGSP